MYIHRCYLTTLRDTEDNYIETLDYISHNNRYETISYKCYTGKRYQYLSEIDNNKRNKSFKMISYNYDISRRIASMQAYNKNYKISSFKK